jgi:hypothetical protein
MSNTKQYWTLKQKNDGGSNRHYKGWFSLKGFILDSALPSPSLLNYLSVTA